MYLGKPWTMRQYAGFSTARATNARFRYLLEAGQTGLSTAFDLPTQMGYDPDDPLAEAEVGKVGVSIATLDDMLELFDGIPLDRVSTSMTINATAIDPARALRRGRTEAGRAGGGALGHDPERHPEGVRGARARTGFRRRRRSGSSRTSSSTRRSTCRSSTPSRSPVITSAKRERPRRRSSRSRSRTGSSTSRAATKRGLAGRPRRAADLVLLQRAERLLRGDREVPRRAADVGDAARGALRARRTRGA